MCQPDQLTPLLRCCWGFPRHTFVHQKESFCLVYIKRTLKHNIYSLQGRAGTVYILYTKCRKKDYTLADQCGSPVEHGFPETEEAVEATDWAASRFACSLIGRVTVLKRKMLYQYVKRKFEMTGT